MTNPALDDLISRGVALRAVFDGLPVEGAAQIASESVERIALTPEGGKWAEAGIGIEESLATVLLGLVGVEPPLSTLGVKSLDLGLRASLALYKRHAAADLAAKRALGEGSTSPPPAG